ncbi:MAG: sigma-54 dependent transcriptional regulator [Schleiferiaceae bacterium]|jgi:two-component system, NtrC family, nitrogen regulation response regulator NtrX|nr:sigma-54-dependent Fis family transcriptional regulator [Flavobacteriaceae bacterium]MDP4615998.1 sigma-54 dependent transcriptional regulator [Schleiferiaceae bacterium]MDP4759211.1 sigma-54 dependent transcriptional regulator [Schleiferiaceae bacterium]MDP4768234.1 sigma-54 dependent transcriptional regulator [Schleiferiaceae bacterium]MDP4878130.1 sigma-54 dependent transcriptional regulator [Schleiferiaceae bacterium]
MSRILLIEDEEAIRRVLKKILLEEDASNDVQEASDGKQAIEVFGDGAWDLVFCDIKMPHMDGVEVLERMMAINPEVPVIMISGHGDINTAVDCLKKGAFDYLPKPPDLNRLLSTVRHALEKKTLVQEVKTLKKKVSKKYTMIGESSGMLELRGLIEKVAPSEARVLITGPNGSGKELVAHQMHEQSVRSKNAMVEVNCAAIPAELIESELFGHKKGAFTGAQKDRKGKFELAHGGTLFLDEIGDMSLSAQAKVLRALQEHQITPVGGDRSIKVDVRVLAATNKDLRKEIELGKFREDLYHRLSVILIEVPGLNDRRDDIPLLAQHFLQQIADDYGVPAKTISVQAVSALQGYDWTGNIREFRNVIERLHILGGSEISATDVSTFARK